MTEPIFCDEYFFLTRKSYYSCVKGLDKVGAGHPNHNPLESSCCDFSLFCCPLALSLDIVCMPFKYIRKTLNYCFCNHVTPNKSINPDEKT